MRCGKARFHALVDGTIISCFREKAELMRKPALKIAFTLSGGDFCR